jgi:hypothetical protein
MQDQANATPAPRRVPWNKEKLTGQSHRCDPTRLIDPDNSSSKAALATSRCSI